MLNIKISTASGGKPFIKQLPAFKPAWGNCNFFINEEIKECDLWVVYGGLEKQESVLCSKTLFITNEPPSVKKYSEKFLKQFDTILTCDKNTKHSNIISSQQALPWWVGHKIDTDFKKKFEYSKTYDELKSITEVPKTKTLSIIVSNKTFTNGHRKRFDFARKLQEALGENIDIFGLGLNKVEDKWDAIAPYKYHIVIENSAYEDYWTEKLADAFLGLSYPIYYGCTNINKYFPKDSLSIIDIGKPDEAIAIIQKIIQNNLYETSKKEIEKAKDLILDKYQIFPMLFYYANSLPRSIGKKLITINPESEHKITQWFNKIIKIL